MAERPGQQAVSDENGSRVIRIATPARDLVHAAYAQCLASLLAAHGRFTNDVLQLSISRGTIISSQRTALVRDALADGADWIVFIDSDMTFPEDTVHRLLEHDKPVVACDASRRREPVGNVTYVLDEQLGFVTIDPFVTDGLVKVDVIGLAVVAVKADVFRELPEPWFHTPWIQSSGRFGGEDAWFARITREAGIPIYVDLGLSQEIGHLGEKEYTLEDVRAQAAFQLEEPDVQHVR